MTEDVNADDIIVNVFLRKLMRFLRKQVHSVPTYYYYCTTYLGKIYLGEIYRARLQLSMVALLDRALRAAVKNSLPPYAQATALATCISAWRRLMGCIRLTLFYRG